MTMCESFRTNKFKREFKSFKKKCRSIVDDFERFERVLNTQITINENNVPESEYYRISGIGEGFKCDAFIAKKFHCENMNRGSNSGFRISFIYCKESNELFFIQIYFKSKNSTQNADLSRIVKQCDILYS
jgi:hypothetical protein